MRKINAQLQQKRDLPFLSPNEYVRQPVYKLYWVGMEVISTPDVQENVTRNWIISAQHKLLSGMISLRLNDIKLWVNT